MSFLYLRRSLKVDFIFNRNPLVLIFYNFSNIYFDYTIFYHFHNQRRLFHQNYKAFKSD